MKGLVQRKFKSFEKRMLNNPHAQLDFMTRSDLENLKKELLQEIYKLNYYQNKPELFDLLVGK